MPVAINARLAGLMAERAKRTANAPDPEAKSCDAPTDTFSARAEVLGSKAAPEALMTVSPPTTATRAAGACVAVEAPTRTEAPTPTFV